MCDINATFRQFSYWGLTGHCDHDMYNSHDSRETFVRVSYVSRETFVSVSHDCFGTIVRMSLSFISIN